MSEPTGPLLSVRGDARLTVAPDYVILSGAIELTRDAKADAVRAAAAALDGLTADLAALGAVALSPETERSRLTWSAQSAATRPERENNEQTGNYEPTGRVIATVDVMIAARDFALLDALGAALATHESFNVRDAGWHVDWDNPAWPQVRAAAIQAAIHKGHDYAAALGGPWRLHDPAQLRRIARGGAFRKWHCCRDFSRSRSSPGAKIVLSSRVWS